MNIYIDIKDTKQYLLLLCYLTTLSFNLPNAQKLYTYLLKALKAMMMCCVTFLNDINLLLLFRGYL